MPWFRVTRYLVVDSVTRGRDARSCTGTCMSMQGRDSSGCVHVDENVDAV